MEIILAIAALCTINNGKEYLHYVDKQQLACQKYYAECLENKRNFIQRDLLKCISERPDLK